MILAFTVGQFAFENYLQYRQYQILKRTTPPASLKAEVTQEVFDKTQKYSRAKAKFGAFKDVYGLVQNIAVIKYDLLPKAWTLSGFLLKKVAHVLPSFMGGVITQSVILFAINQLYSTVTSLPISYYSNFILEEKFGFNKLTLGLWILDTVKWLVLGNLLGSGVLAGFLKIIDSSSDSFVGYLMLFVLGVQLVLMTIFPLYIQPLFNKMTPLEDGELKTAIEKLAASEEFPLTKLFVMDGSKRSSHSNAFFTGLPWSKQIVLYDTLIEHSTVEETVAVLAHEIGHWKLSHLPKMLTASQAHLFVVFSLFSAFVRNNSLYSSFGFTGVQPTLVGFLLFNDIFTPFECLAQFGTNLLVRKHEYEADAFAKSRGYSEELSKSLLKMFSENLSTLESDPLYSAYHYSHPTLPERLSALGYVSNEKVGGDIDPLKEKSKEKSS